MAFNLQFAGPGDDAATVTVNDRSEAFTIVSQWQKAGRTGIKIIGDGRIYTPEEFALTIVDPRN
jgi:hypothetical protein